jgi:nitroreductase
MDVIYKRRSYHQGFDGTRKVSGEDVNAILKAGMNAPSAFGSQPWEFLVIDDEELLKKFADLTGGTGSMATASFAVFLCADADGQGYQDFNIGVAAENMLLEATSRDIGSLTMGIYPNDEAQSKIREAVGLPDDMNAYLLLDFGYPTEILPPNDRFIEEKVHRNKW